MPDNESNTGPSTNVTASSGSSITPAAGPLVVSETNPRYFAVESDNAPDRRMMYLTGSHVNNNFHDGSGPGTDCADTPEPNDFRGYLEFLKERGHNFIRLWRWEQFRSQVAGGAFHFCMTPQPWSRTGPRTARDGKPKFDLSRFDPAYFDRLRGYAIAAGNEGIYVSVMLFEGFGLHLSLAPDNVEGHPLYAANNVNGIGIASINDYQVLPLDPRVQALQEAYIRKVVYTLQDLPNVLYEVANESSGGGSIEDAEFLDAIGLSEPPDWGDSTQWQYWVIDFLKRYEAQMGYARHPVGMTMQYPVRDQSKVNHVLFDGPADWISPGFDDVDSPMQNSRWYTDPPANDGTKVIISDTDHYSPMKSDALWAWKSFLRGHNPIPYDLGILTGVNPPDPFSGNPSFASLEPARHAMGDTLRFAREMDLAGMEPRGGSQLYRLRAREPRRGVPRPPARRDGRTFNRGVGSQHLLGPVAQRPQPRGERRRQGDCREPRRHHLRGPFCGGRPDGAAPESGRRLTAMSGAEDGVSPRARCAWVGADPLYVAYHDEEWGVPVHDDQRLFEMLVLEGAQAGLSWLTILKKRGGYRHAFDGFDPEKVARYGERKVEELLADPGIVRNRRKVEATVRNARSFLAVREEFGTFDRYLWGFVGGEPAHNRWRTPEEVPAETEASRVLSRDLKRRGFGFAGPTVVYAFMQAVGMVNDHTTDCFRHAQLVGSTDHRP